MNFLAHLYLSGNDDDLIVGNFIADMVKGQQINGYDPGIIQGIRLHRKIDQFTDKHHVFLQSKARLRAKYRLYAGVIVDMYYDHFLARYWPEYSRHPLSEYVARTYTLLQKHIDMLPPRAKFILPFMVDNNWLVNYADLSSLGNNFGGMARRTPFDSGMEEAVIDLKSNYQTYETEFRMFFPELTEFVATQGVSHAHHGLHV